MEIGSFIELDLRRGNELYPGDSQDIARLNFGRGGIYHAARVLGVKNVWVPAYQCDTVRDFLNKEGMGVKYCRIDEGFNPVDIEQDSDDAVLLVNYWGVMSAKRMESLASRYKRVIIDNSQALFAEPLDGAMNVYSPRKFVGVPDGCYVVGEGAAQFCDSYERDMSADTSLFLLKRIESGCEGAYSSRMENENKFEECTVKLMSPLTRALLDNADYEYNRRRRRENFETAHILFGGINRIDPTRYYSSDCVPMVYPFVYESDGLLPYMQKKKIFQGHWWSYILDELPSDRFEYYLSRYIIPITIDQRYGKAEIEFCRRVAEDYINGKND